MTASALTTARPPSTAIAWATRDAIFVEIPCKGSAPYICRYPRTSEGLVAALNILIENPEPAPRSIPATHPAIKRAKPEFNDAEREKVRDILKGMKVI